MNSLTQRIFTCASIGAIFTLLALASGANYFLVALAFASGTACAWIFADPKGFLVACKERLSKMKMDLRKRQTPYEKWMSRLELANVRSGLWCCGIFFGQSVVFGSLFGYAFYPFSATGTVKDPGVLTLGLVWAIPVYILLTVWLFKQDEGSHSKIAQPGREKFIRDIRWFRWMTSKLNSYEWLPFYVLGTIKVLARIVESIPKIIGWFWRHFVALMKSAHTEWRLVSSTCVCFGMVIGYAIGLKTDSLMLGTLAGGAGGAFFVIIDWFVLSVALGWREKAPSN